MHNTSTASERLAVDGAYGLRTAVEAIPWSSVVSGLQIQQSMSDPWRARTSSPVSHTPNLNNCHAATKSHNAYALLDRGRRLGSFETFS
jgi:hypothetical protein